MVNLTQLYKNITKNQKVEEYNVNYVDGRPSKCFSEI